MPVGKFFYADMGNMKGVFIMKKHFKKLLSVAVVTGLMTTMTCMSVSAEEADGFVTVSVEKFSIGQGYVSQPKTVPFYEGDNGIDIVKRAVGEENVVVTDGGWGSYISGFVDSEGEVVLPDCVAEVVDVATFTGRADEDVLSEFDYTSESGFIFFVNCESSSVGISDYVPCDGDVISLRFSVYNYGADVGCDNSSWGGSPSLIGEVDRCEATRLIAEINAVGNADISDEMAVICDLDSTQEEIDLACKSIEEKLNSAIKTPDEEIQKEDNEGDIPSDTGFSVGMLLPAVIGVCAIVSKKKDKI